LIGSTQFPTGFAAGSARGTGEVQTAVRPVLPGGPAKGAVSGGGESVVKFNAEEKGLCRGQSIVSNIRTDFNPEREWVHHRLPR
jgi:hypothetical protein